MILPSAVILLLCSVLLDIAKAECIGCNVCGRPNSQYYAKYRMCYFLVDDNVEMWNDACTNIERATLAVVKDSSVNQILIEIAADAGYTSGFDAWIGLDSDLALNPSWHWIPDDIITADDYENFPGPLPNVQNQCGTFATPPLVDSIGEWDYDDCTVQKYYFCQVPYMSPCTWPKNSFWCPETNLCYCLRSDPLLNWEDARESCQEGASGGDLAIPDCLELSRQLRNLVDDFYSDEDTWAAWIGGHFDLITDFQWDWWNDVPIGFNGFNNFPGQSLPGGIGCVNMNNIGRAGGLWDNRDCATTHWFFCQSTFPYSACCDPHFVVRPRGLQDYVCFDYYGQDKDVLQLVYNKKYNLAVNGEVFSHPHTKKTWFGALSLIVPECTVVADFKGILMNGKPVKWIETEDQQCGSSGVTYSIKDDQHRHSTHLILKVAAGVEFVFSKDQKTYKFGSVEYMDFDMTQYYKLDESTDGILGEFLGMTVSLDGDRVRNDTDTGMLYFTDEPGRASVTAHRVSRKNLLTNQHFHCWNVEDEGAGLVRGRAKDYLVADLLTDQRGRSFLQTEGEAAADATF